MSKPDSQTTKVIVYKGREYFPDSNGVYQV